MRINEYQKLEDFINEYDGKMEVGDEFHMGIEFKYKDTMYRMCREATGQFFLYKVTIPWFEAKTCEDINYETIGIYQSIEELLETREINDIPFSEVIMSDETLIDSKD